MASGINQADDELLQALRDRAAGLRPPASPDEIREAESKLGFPLPLLLRRVYGVANGGLGPARGLYPIADGEDALVSVHRQFAGARYTPEPGEPGFEQGPWPARLLPICDWGCAIWSCLDCYSADGPIVTSSNGEPFTSTGHTLGSWLSSWLAGVDLFEEMFEPGPTRTGINPFTKQPIVLKGQGKPRGARWAPP